MLRKIVHNPKCYLIKLSYLVFIILTIVTIMTIVIIIVVILVIEIMKIKIIITIKERWIPKGIENF